MTLLPLLIACVPHQPPQHWHDLPPLDPPAELLEWTPEEQAEIDSYDGCPEVALIPSPPHEAEGLPLVGEWPIYANQDGWEAWGAPCDGMALPTSTVLWYERQADLVRYWQDTAVAERHGRLLDRATADERYRALQAAHSDVESRERVLRWALGVGLPLAVTGAAAGGVWLGAGATAWWE